MDACSFWNGLNCKRGLHFRLRHNCRYFVVKNTDDSMFCNFSIFRPLYHNYILSIYSTCNGYFWWKNQSFERFQRHARQIFFHSNFICLHRYNYGSRIQRWNLKSWYWSINVILKTSWNSREKNKWNLVKRLLRDGKPSNINKHAINAIIDKS